VDNKPFDVYQRVRMSASLFIFILALLVPKEADTIVWFAWIISLFINFK
jgi:hypothetical protein